MRRNINHRGRPINATALRRRILDRTATLAVVGQGYVGLSLACAAAEEGFNVIGIDANNARSDDLQREILSVPGVPAEAFRRATATNHIRFSSDFTGIETSDIIVVCVPTPLRNHTPDLSYVEQACVAVTGHLRPGGLVILESTTYPGTTEEVVRPLLEAGQLRAGEDFLLAYSPERIDPGNDEFGFRAIPRILGGTSPQAAAIASLFYGQLVDKVVALSSCKAAELAKLLENTFRHVNVALVNEMAMLCHETGIDVWEVIEAAATKPFGFMPFYPGPGVGGHCIPLDPAYLAWQVRRDAGRQFRVLEQAQDINAQMPVYVASRIGDALNEVGLAVKGSTILVLGVSYKADVGDIRESPALKVITVLRKRGARVAFHDPYVESLPLSGGLISKSDLSSQDVSGADCVAILTPHTVYDLAWIADRANLVFDARNAFGDDCRPNVLRL